MMMWTLLQLPQENEIYEGKLRSCPYQFLEDILNGNFLLDSLSSLELVSKLDLWLRSDDFVGKAIGTSTLAAQVLNCSC